MTWTVYMLRCGDESLYSGITNNLPARLQAHRMGKGAKYTKGRGPLTIAWSEEVPDKSSALKLEAKIKKLPKNEKERLALSSNPLLEAFVLLNEAELQDIRAEMVDQYSWAIPSEAAIRAIAELSPIVEMGAGTGYWAKMLLNAGADVVAYDMSPPGCQNSLLTAVNLYHPGAKKLHAPVLVGEPKVLKNFDRTLFLCWPPISPMAFQCLKHWKGKNLVHVGELGGRTGSDEFLDILENRFRLSGVVEIPSWPGFHDCLTIWERRS